MKPAVLMMFRDEADILGECLEHWYNLGVRDFYLCDNGSVDNSIIHARTLGLLNDVNMNLFSDPATDWPGRRVINDLKNRALDDGCDWIFPADADEFLVLREGWNSLPEFLDKWPQSFDWWGILQYLNVLPDGREYWQHPQGKCFGLLNKEMTISMGNHTIEGVQPSLMFGQDGPYYRHYSLRTYRQFRRKMENYMIAFAQTQFQDHHHAESYRQWKKEGEPFLQRRWTELTGLPCE